MASKRYRSKPGPDPIPEEERRLLFTISLANRKDNGALLNRFRDAVALREGGPVSRSRLIEIAKDQSVAGIYAYIEAVEREQERVLTDL